jgi:hypothetical protein
LGGFGCSGSSDPAEGTPAPAVNSAAPTSAPSAAEGDGEGGAAAPAAPDEVEPPIAEAPPPSVDPLFDAAAPARGGAHDPFEVVPQDILAAGTDAELVSPDGRLTAVASYSGMVAVYDARRGVIRASRRLFRSLYDEDMHFAWDGSSNHLAAFVAGELCLWHLSTDDYVCAESSEATHVSVGRGGRRVAYIGLDDHAARTTALYTWTMERRPHKVAVLPPRANVRATAAYGNHVLATFDGHTWLYDARGRNEPVDLGEVSLPEHPFVPNGRAFITFGDDVVQLRSATDGAVQHEQALEGAQERVRVAPSRDGGRVALCAPDGPLALVRLSATPSAEAVAEQVCTDESRPALAGSSARVVPLNERGLNPEHRREASDSGREHSLWSLELSEGRAVLHRRGGAEAFSAAGVRRARTQVADGEDYDDDGYFDGLVARSPTRHGVLRVNRHNHPVLLTRSTRVTLADAHALSCDEYMGCAISVRWDREERRVALMHANLVEIFDTTSGERLGTWRTGRGCAEACGDGLVCVHGACEEPTSAIGSAEFSPDGERLVAIGMDGSVGLHNIAGERLQRLAGPDHTAGARQSFTFSPDSQHVAFLRRRRLTMLRAADGTEVWRVELPHTLTALAFSADGAALHALDSAGQASTLSAADGSVSGAREAGPLRAVDGHGRYAVTCREGLTYLQYLDHGTERGPLGRCPRGGRFIIAPDSGLLGHVRGTLARVHRLSDGEVLNVRSVWRDNGRIRMAFTDSGWAQVIGGRAIDVYVRTGSVSRGHFRTYRGSDRARETLLADFFGGVALPPPPGAAAEEPGAEAPAAANAPD